MIEVSSQDGSRTMVPVRKLRGNLLSCLNSLVCSRSVSVFTWRPLILSLCVFFPFFIRIALNISEVHPLPL